MVIPASAGAAFGPATSFGGTGTGNGKFSHPQSAVVDPSGSVYVTDTSNSRLEKFDSAGNFAASLTATGNFSPQDVAVDSLGNVYAAAPHRVVVWNALGVQIGDWAPAGVGTAYGIAVDGGGNAYISDVQNSRIRKFNGVTGVPDGSVPVFGAGHLLQPQGLTTDSSSNIYVADPSNNAIEKFLADGTFVTRFQMPTYTVYANGGTFAGVVHPQDVAVDAGGRIFAPDTGTHSNLVAVLSSTGDPLQVFGAPDSDPGNACAVRSPWGLATSSGSLYVVSTGEDQIRVFNETGTACPTPDFGSPPSPGGGGTGLPGGVSPEAVANDRTKPTVTMTGFPRRCARKDFTFVVHAQDDVLVNRIVLFVQRRRAANQEVNQQEFNFRVHIPVNKVRREIPRGFIFKVLVMVKATDLAGHKTKVSRSFGICGAG